MTSSILKYESLIWKIKLTNSIKKIILLQVTTPRAQRYNSSLNWSQLLKCIIKE